MRFCTIVSAVLVLTLSAGNAAANICAEANALGVCKQTCRSGGFYTAGAAAEREREIHGKFQQWMVGMDAQRRKMQGWEASDLKDMRLAMLDETIAERAAARDHDLRSVRDNRQLALSRCAGSVAEARAEAAQRERIAAQQAARAANVARATFADTSALGVSAGNIQQRFARANIAMAYKDAPLYDGTPRIMGTGNTSILELTGPKDDLSKVALNVAFASDNAAANLDGLLRMIVVLNMAAPGLPDPAGWTKDAISHLVSDPDGESFVTLTDRNVRMTRTPALGMVHLTVESHAPPTVAAGQ